MPSIAQITNYYPFYNRWHVSANIISDTENIQFWKIKVIIKSGNSVWINYNISFTDFEVSTEDMIERFAGNYIGFSSS